MFAIIHSRQATKTIASRFVRCLPAKACYAKQATIEQDDISDETLIEALADGSQSHHQLEKLVDAPRAVQIRRKYFNLAQKQDDTAGNIAQLPYEAIDANDFYSRVQGANAECVVGYIPMPVGVAGPLRLDGNDFNVPMATTEGALIASTNRGARAIHLSGGASSEVLSEGMTRAPVVTMPTVVHAAHLKKWIEEPQRIDYLREVFSSTTRFGKLQKVDATVAGRHVYLRFSCSTGDAMGMNMVGKGINTVMADLQQNHFPELRLVSLSGNMCIDKKPSALNWINGRGKSVVAGVTLTGDVVRKVLKTTPAAMAELNVTKNLVGSAMAGSIGGFNAHASNVVTACFLAMGQDPAQNVESSTCITQMELINNGEDLYVSVTMPSIEVGTIGGGTGLPAAKACLSMALGNIPQENPGDGARALARVVAGTVLAGEISLLAALSSGHLISAHMDLNRKPSTTI